MALFHAAMRDVAPLPISDKIAHSGSKIPPVPRKESYQEKAASEDALSDHISIEIEAGDEWSYVRPGMSHQTLRRLRRGYWRIQENLDLHGLTRDEARQELSAFLAECLQKKFRCIRVIHGKGLTSCLYRWQIASYIWLSFGSRHSSTPSLSPSWSGCCAWSRCRPCRMPQPLSLACSTSMAR